MYAIAANTPTEGGRISITTRRGTEGNARGIGGFVAVMIQVVGARVNNAAVVAASNTGTRVTAVGATVSMFDDLRGVSRAAEKESAES